MHRLASLRMHFIDTDDGDMIIHNGFDMIIYNGFELSLVAKVKEKQNNNPLLSQLLNASHYKKVEVFFQGRYSALLY